MKIFFSLLALLLCLPNISIAYFNTNEENYTLGFVPVTIDLANHLAMLAKADELDLHLFNAVLSKKIIMTLVECDGDESLSDFLTLYKTSLANIVLHTRWQTKAAERLDERPQQDVDVQEDSHKQGKLDDNAHLQRINKALISKHSQCKKVTNAYLSLPQILGVKLVIDASITETFFDWVKKNRSYLQYGWQALVWGSGISKYYFGHNEIIPHLFEYSDIYLRVLFSATPFLIQIYNGWKGSLTVEELSTLAQRLQIMSDVQIALIGNRKTIEHDTLINHFIVKSLPARFSGLEYSRYLIFKRLLKKLVESNPKVVAHESSFYHEENFKERPFFQESVKSQEGQSSSYFQSNYYNFDSLRDSEQYYQQKNQ